MTWIHLLYLTSFIYVFSMLIWPLYVSDDWWGFIEFLHKWQSLNVGVIALTASVIFYVTTNNREKANRIERLAVEESIRCDNLIAEKAFLPHALSELTTYNKLCAESYKNAWKLFALPRGERDLNHITIPKLSGEYKETFRQCIKFSDVKTSKYLARIIENLQISTTRVRSLKNTNIGSQHSVEADLFFLLMIQVRLNQVFPYARAEQHFINHELSEEDFSNARTTIQLDLNLYDRLHDRIKDKVKNSIN